LTIGLPMIRVTHFMRKTGGHSIERLFEDVRNHLPRDIEVRVCESRFCSRGLFGRVYDILRARRHQGDVNHVTGDVHFLTYFLDRRRTILTILDCVNLERLQGFKRWLLWAFWYWLPEKRSAAITVISEATRKHVLRHLRCNPDKIHVIHCSVSPEFRPAPKLFNSTKPRMLLIGTTPNKNLERVAAALAGLDCDVTIIGKLSVGQVNALNTHRVSYENLVDLSRAALVEQYQRCDVVIFASTYEGFGLPIVEGNAVGRPVVTSEMWSMPEVAGDAACLVDPFDVKSIRGGVLKVMNDAAYRDELVRRGFENVERFRPEKIAREYADVYRELLGS
jgi:glycosyltransferase involved in cell wall biosynthesis